MDECARMSCNQPAVALLTFAPPQAKAWLYDLVDPDPTNGIILCRKHANSTVVPMSWQLVDARDPAWPGPALTEATAPTPTTSPVSSSSPAAAAERAPLRPLPSDNGGLDNDFAALGDLPIHPRPYTAPREVREAVNASSRAVPGAQRLAEAEANRGDPSLFELSLGDVPAVTPHPGFS